MTQESTEDLTTNIILDSKDIMKLLKRDNLLLEEVNDYHIYPIADNDTPQLSADRLEYSLSNALLTYELLDIENIKEIYNDIEVQKNEKNIDELSFKTKSIARKFVKVTSQLSIIYREDRTRFSMQFLADIMKKLNEENIIKIEDLYNLKESEVLEIIKKSKYKEQYKLWEQCKKIKSSIEKPKDVYYIKHGAKIRYINPLVNGKRITEICKIAKNMIDKNLQYDMSKYIYIENLILK